MPVVPPEKLIQLQRTADNVRNICIMAHVVSVSALRRCTPTDRPGPWQNLAHRCPHRHQWHHLPQARRQDPLPRLAPRRAAARHYHGVVGHLALLLAAAPLRPRCAARAQGVPDKSHRLAGPHRLQLRGVHSIASLRWRRRARGRRRGRVQPDRHGPAPDVDREAQAVARH
jgi:hypothetical protein